MKSVFVDKIASVAQHSNLSQELRLSADIPCEEGVLVAAKVLNNKTRYNQLELTSGRMAKSIKAISLLVRLAIVRRCLDIPVTFRKNLTLGRRCRF